MKKNPYFFEGRISRNNIFLTPILDEEWTIQKFL